MHKKFLILHSDSFLLDVSLMLIIGVVIYSKFIVNTSLLDDDKSIWNNCVHVFEKNIPRFAPMSLLYVLFITDQYQKKILGRLYWSANAAIAFELRFLSATLVSSNVLFKMYSDWQNNTILYLILQLKSLIL
jgi:hypothetical protein